MRPARRAVTLLELSLAAALLTVVLAVSQSAAHALGRGERRADREATRALVEAQVLEVLLSDVRSSTAVTRVTDTEWRVTRWVAASEGLVPRDVVWTTDGRTRVTRRPQGEPAHQWPLPGLAGEGDAVFRLKLERLDDARLP